MSERALPPELVALTPGDLDGERAGDLERCVEAARLAVGAGLRAILVREPRLSDRAFLDLALELRAILSAPGSWLAVHDRVHLAQASGAQAVHLGFRSLAPAQARAILPPSVGIGFSAHEGDDETLWSAADYLFYGPVLDTPSKRGWKPPIGFDALASAARRSTTPIWAIGGLVPEHGPLALAAGCRGIAVRGALFGARDPVAAYQRFAAALATG